MSNIFISLASQFDAKGFKQAEAASNKLLKTSKKLAGAFGLAFSVEGIARFSATAVKAFAAEEKQIAALTTTVKNLGLSFAAPEANQFIENMERMTGVAREELQPAFQKLLTQTGSLINSQRILNSAVEISFSGLMSVSEAADILTKAYVGNTKGLKALNLGLSNAELNAMTFGQILDKVSKVYKGQFNAAQDTTQVKLDKFNVAVGNAIESVGQGLVGAFANLAGSGDLDKANAGIEQFGKNLGNVLIGITDVQGLMSKSQGLGFSDYVKGLVGVNKAFKQSLVTMGPNLGSPAAWRAANKAAIEAAKKLAAIEAAKLKTLREQAAAKKLAQTIDKANLMLNTAKDVFDLERISVTAAMANNTLTENERKRLEIKQAIFALEDAIDAKDQKRIDAAMKTLGALGSQLAVLQLQDSTLGGLKVALDALGTNKDLINLDNLNQAILKLQQMNLLLNGTKTPTATTSLSSGTNPTGSPYVYSPISKPYIEMGGNAAIDAASKIAAQAWDDHEKKIARTMNPNYQPSIVIKVDPKVDDLVKFVMDTVTEQSASGNPPFIGRVGESFAW